jgi:hypothetical protein
LLFNDEAIVLSTEGVDFEHVTATAIPVRIDQDFEVVIQFLAHIAAQFCRDDPGRLRVIAVDSEIDRVTRIEYSYLSFLRRRLTFVGLSLPKISD